MKLKFNLIPVIAMTGVLLLSACQKEDDVVIPEPMQMNLVETAQEAGVFSTLILAAEKTGLAGYLSTEKDITVFAPTDDAFAALLQDLGANSLDDIPLETLTNVLLYHVIGSKAMSTDLSTGYFPTLASYDENNISMYIKVDGGVYINKNTMVSQADIEADNGVIHVVDKVILPPSVVNIAIDNDNFTTLVDAVVKAGLVDVLSGNGPFTVFAPTNAAFNTLFSELGISGINDLTAEDLIPILTYHVVSGNVLSGELVSGKVGTLYEGKEVNIDLSNGVKINESSVVSPDVQGANGVIHVIDKVLLPE